VSATAMWGHKKAGVNTESWCQKVVATAESRSGKGCLGGFGASPAALKGTGRSQ